MSRNEKLRKIAAELPRINKLDVKGRTLTDPNGYPIEVDHFKRLLAIRDDIRAHRGSKQAEIQAIGDYCVMVKEADKAYKRKRYVRNVKIVVTIIGLILLAIYLQV